MTLTEFQVEILHMLSKRPLEPYGLQVGTCRALEKKGLALFHPVKTVYEITDKGREAINKEQKS